MGRHLPESGNNVQSGYTADLDIALDNIKEFSEFFSQIFDFKPQLTISQTDNESPLADMYIELTKNMHRILAQVNDSLYKVEYLEKSVMKDKDLNVAIVTVQNMIKSANNSADDTYGKKKSGALGILSAPYESGSDPGTVSGGSGDPGGISYGAYQFSSNQGVVDEFIKWLNQHQHPFAEVLLNSGAINSGEFINAWQKIAADNPNEFYKLQHDYISYSHYEPIVKDLAEQGIEVSARSKAMQEVVWSMAVQMKEYTSDIFASALNGRNFASVSDEELIPLLYEYRKNYFSGSSDEVRTIVSNRFEAESMDALQILKFEQAMQSTIIDLQHIVESLAPTTAENELLNATKEKIQQIYDGVRGVLMPLSGTTTGNANFDPLMLNGILMQQSIPALTNDGGGVNIVNNVDVGGVVVQGSDISADAVGSAVAGKTIDGLSERSMYMWQNRIFNGGPSFT